MNTNFTMNTAAEAIVANRYIATKSTEPADFVDAEDAEGYLTAVDVLCHAVYDVITRYDEDTMQGLDNAVFGVAVYFGVDSTMIATSALSYRAITAMSGMVTKKSDDLREAEKEAREARKDVKEAEAKGVKAEKLAALRKVAAAAANHVAVLEAEPENKWYEPRTMFAANMTNASPRARKNLEDLVADVIMERQYKSAATLAMEYAAEQARKKAAREARKAAQKAEKAAAKKASRPTEDAAITNT